VLLVDQGREMFIQRRNGNSSVSSDPGERYIRVPEHGLSNSSSYETSAASMLSSPLQPNVAANEYPSVFAVSSEATSVKESVDGNGESYIRLEDCYSGQPAGTSGTVPLVSVSYGGRAMSPSKKSNAAVDVDADRKVEYCNEYELGEHDSTLVTGNSKHSCTVGAVGGLGCAANDDDDVDYCHYKTPTVHYSIPRTLSELSEPRNVAGSLFREPRYVNCSDMLEWSLNCPPQKRHGICCDLLTYPDVPKLYFEQSLSVTAMECHTIGMFSSDSWDLCRFYPRPGATGTANASANAVSDDDDDDDDEASAHDYVNVPPLHSVVQFGSSTHPLSGCATFTPCGRYD